MEVASRHRIVFLVGIILSMLFMTGCLAQAQTQSVSQPQSVEASLKQFLQSYDRKHSNDKTTRYLVAFKDLNEDGIPEAIVYFMGDGWCGSGGCFTFILKQKSDSWRFVTKITITRPPIRVLTKKSHGWHDIAVWVQGGGIQHGYEAELKYDGKTYPSNPTVPPAQQMKEKVAGETVIPSVKGGTPLYE